MNRSYLTRYTHALRSVLGFRPLLARSREAGHCRRLRDITPQRLVCALLEALGSLRVTTIADILRTFNAQTGLSTRYKPFHKRLAQPEFALFMRQLYLDILRQLSQNVLRAAAPEQLGTSWSRTAAPSPSTTLLMEPRLAHPQQLAALPDTGQHGWSDRS